MQELAADPELRATGMGGSDVARILGLSRFGGAMDVFMEKRRMTAPLIETEPMRWGKILEEPVAREYAVQSGRKVRRAAAFIRHPAYPYLFANIDRWSIAKGTPTRVLEVKTASVFTADDFGEPDTDQVPGDYLAQLMHYLSVTGKESGDLAVLIGGQKFAKYHLDRDDELIRDMTERCVEFWRNTQQGIPPEVDGSEAASAYLRATFRDKGTELAMSADLAALAHEFEGVKVRLKELESLKETIGNGIRAVLGDNRWAEGEGVRIVYGERKGSTKVDWPAVVGELSADPSPVIAKHTTIGEPVRTLVVTVKPA